MLKSCDCGELFSCVVCLPGVYVPVDVNINRHENSSDFMDLLSNSINVAEKYDAIMKAGFTVGIYSRYFQWAEISLPEILATTLALKIGKILQ